MRRVFLKETLQTLLCNYAIIIFFHSLLCRKERLNVRKSVRSASSFSAFFSVSKRLKSLDKRPILGCIGFHSCKSLDAGKVLGPFLVSQSSSFCTQYQKWIFQRSNQAFFCNVMHLHTENCFHFIFLCAFCASIATLLSVVHLALKRWKRNFSRCLFFHIVSQCLKITHYCLI